MKNNKPLVSIISPCYNGEPFVGRMLESILSQTYTNIEMICVNDGSTDRTEEVILSYGDRFQDKGWRLICINQENRGQAAALNEGLKLFTGDYLCWIDCDDFLTDDSIEKRVQALEDNSEYGIVTSDCNVVKENDLGRILYRDHEKLGNLKYQKWQFGLLLAGKSSFIPVCHMIRAKSFFAVNPDREIYPGTEGQNIQMLLPIYYSFPRLYVDEPLCYYVIRENSHYHRKRTSEELRKRQEILLTTARRTLEGMGLPEYEIRRCLMLVNYN